MGQGGEERDDLSLVVSIYVIMVAPSVLPSYQSRNTNTNADDNVFVQLSNQVGVRERHIGTGLSFPLSDGGNDTVQLFRKSFGILFSLPCKYAIKSR